MTASMIADYPHALGGHCGSGSMRDLLGWAGLSYGDRPLGEGTDRSRDAAARPASLASIGP